MGVLRDHVPLLTASLRAGYLVFAETGTGTGTGMETARGFGFSRLFSCDVDKEQITNLRARWMLDSRIGLFAGTSVDFINWLLASGHADIKPDTRIVWFLDAHFPGFDLGKAAIDAEKDLDIRLPLHTELRLLHRYGRTKDVIVIDDLRVYEVGPYQGGTMEQHNAGHVACYDKPLPLDLWEPTHDIKRDYRDGGYLILVPKTLEARA